MFKPGLLLLLSSALAFGCDGLFAPAATPRASAVQCAATPPAASSQPRVIPLFLAPPDVDCAARAQQAAALHQVLIGVQGWFGKAMAGPTFVLDAPQSVGSVSSRAQWDAFGAAACGIYDAAFAELKDGGALAAAGLPALGTPGVVYVVVGGGGSAGGCGAGAAGMAAVDLHTLAHVEARCPDGRIATSTSCSSAGAQFCDGIWYERDDNCMGAGAIAHELGHAFGLNHGVAHTDPTELAECHNKTLMDIWWTFGEPGAPLLCEPDHHMLEMSGYFG